MSDNPTSPEQRQHINISQYAYDVIRNDSINFLGKLNISGFINTIVENTMTDSFDDYSLMEEDRIKDELKAIGIKLSVDEEKTLKKIAEAHSYATILSHEKYHKDITLKIRLNQKIYKSFYPKKTEWFGKGYGLSQGAYIKILIEEYAKKTYYNRESIFFQKRIEELNSIIFAEESQKRILAITMKDGSRFFCKLYRLSEEYETRYHYLIGLFANEGTSDYKISSIRLSRIDEIKVRGRSLGSGSLSNNEIKRINKRIKDSSIPYLRGEPMQFKIKLTDLGMLLYDYIYSQRPLYKEPIKPNPDGTYTLKVEATERQIKNYFFAFGKEALIESPDETKKWMIEQHTNATDAYLSL